MFRGNLITLGCVLMTLALGPNLDAEKSTAAPQIKATWTQSFDLGYVTLSITNQGDSPISVGALADDYCDGFYKLIQMERELELQKMKVQKLPSEVEDKTITEIIIFNVMRQNTGPMELIGPGPVEINPGETKTIKFLIEDDLLKQNPNQVTFLLSQQGNVLSKVIMAKLGNTWKEKT